MTERSYFDNDALEMETTVISCTPQDDGRFRVILAATLFHPQGGGQPSDRGTLGTADMLHAAQEDGEIAHYTDGPVAPGPVHIKVDEPLRRLHSHYHSAGHFIAVAGETFGWHGSKGNHRPGEARVVFEPTEQKTPVTAEQIAADVAEIVARDLPRQLTIVDGRREVTWGDLPAYACGGTHVVSTAEVGLVRILKISEKKGVMTVKYEVGESLLE